VLDSVEPDVTYELEGIEEVERYATDPRLRDEEPEDSDGILLDVGADEAALETVVEIVDRLAETLEVDLTLGRVEVVLIGELAEPVEEAMGVQELAELPTEDGVVRTL